MLGYKYNSGITLISVASVIVSNVGFTIAATEFITVISADIAEVRVVSANLRSLLS